MHPALVAVKVVNFGVKSRSRIEGTLSRLATKARLDSRCHFPAAGVDCTIRKGELCAKPRAIAAGAASATRHKNDYAISGGAIPVRRRFSRCGGGLIFLSLDSRLGILGIICPARASAMNVGG